jgi:hypothetical protein
LEGDGEVWEEGIEEMLTCHVAGVADVVVVVEGVVGGINASLTAFPIYIPAKE